MIFGTPKSHQCRSVPVSRSLIDALAEACVGKNPADLLFTAPRGGVLMLRNWRRRVFDPALAAAALGELTRTSSVTPPPASPSPRAPTSRPSSVFAD